MPASPRASDTTPLSAIVEHLHIVNFRCFDEVRLDLGPRLTVVHSANGQGKTTLLEAMGWVARTRSFRGVPDGMLVRTGCHYAIVRAEIMTGVRRQLFEAEIRVKGRNRVRWNKQSAARSPDVTGWVHVTVFAPDDLRLVKDGPTERRAYLDELLVMLSARYDSMRTDYERVVKHRNALLRAGVRTDTARTTLELFDEQLVRLGAQVARSRLQLVQRLAPAVEHAYRELAGETTIEARYQADWAPPAPGATPSAQIEGWMRDAIERRRRVEMERGMTLVGPHRDDWQLTIDGLDARTQTSQGEQRTLALALRLAGHGVVTEHTGVAPVLLLDDVFSELDSSRAGALVRSLPPGQTVITTAGALPAELPAGERLVVARGRVVRDVA